jgi:hypothetical protein
VVAGQPLGIEGVEVVAPEFAVRAALPQDVVRDHEDAVGDGDDGVLVPAPLDQPAVLRREVGVARADGAAGALHERLAQDAVRAAGTAAQPLAGTLVVAGAEAGPGGGLAGGREATSVGSVATAACDVVSPSAQSVARQWDEEILSAIRVDFPRPPVHARNLFHLAVAMWDAWAAYDDTADGYLFTEKVPSARREADRAAAISLPGPPPRLGDPSTDAAFKRRPST